jgi:hypothetical protein
MPNLTPEGRERLLAFADDLTAQADRFDMHAWIGARDFTKVLSESAPGEHGTVEACGTTCCIAGGIVLHHRGLSPGDIDKMLITLPYYGYKLDGTPRVSRAAYGERLARLLGFSSWEDEAARLLFTDAADGDIDVEIRNHRLANRLFHVDNWPPEYGKRYETLGPERPVARAEVAADYIRHYVAVDGETWDLDGDA